MRFTSLAACSLAVLQLLAALASTVQASAAGAEYVPAFKVSQYGVDVPIPAAYLYHEIHGKDRRVDKDYAVWAAAPSGVGLLKGKACNYRFDFTYKDTNGKVYKRLSSGTITECSYLARHTVYPGKLANYGQACVSLYVNGEHRATQCHYIKKCGRFSFGCLL